MISLKKFMCGDTRRPEDKCFYYVIKIASTCSTLYTQQYKKLMTSLLSISKVIVSRPLLHIIGSYITQILLLALFYGSNLLNNTLIKLLK